MRHFIIFGKPPPSCASCCCQPKMHHNWVHLIGAGNVLEVRSMPILCSPLVEAMAWIFRLKIHHLKVFSWKGWNSKKEYNHLAVFHPLEPLADENNAVLFCTEIHVCEERLCDMLSPDAILSWSLGICCCAHFRLVFNIIDFGLLCYKCSVCYVLVEWFWLLLCIGGKWSTKHFWI